MFLAEILFLFYNEYIPIKHIDNELYIIEGSDYMKKIVCLFIMVLSCLLIVPVHADMGPKPSISMNIEGLEGKEYYVTLLSKEKSTGPFSFIKDINTVDKTIDDYEIMLKFYNYKDDYYFLGEHTFSNCTHTHYYEWTYYPPEDFKILIYLVKENKFICSDVYTRYAFHSQFDVKIDTDLHISSIDYHKDLLENNSDDMIRLFLRVFVTIIVELVIALLMKIKDLRSLIVIVVVNFITQLFLNGILYLYMFDNILYVLEMIVVILEGMIYQKCLKDISLKKVVQYTLIANISSFVIGEILLTILPHIF